MILKRKASVILMVVMALVLVTTVAYAITITIDGTKEAVWTTGAGGQLPGNVVDLNEGDIADALDMSGFSYTNDSTYFYMLIETFANTGWDSFTAVRADICMDTDNNASTGFSYPNCVGMTGIDRFTRITGDSGSLSFQVRNGSNTVIYNSVAGDIANSGTVTELRVPLATFGMDATTCLTAIALNIYFDGGTTDPDDNSPDSSTTPITCGSPTAVTLQNVAASGSSVLPFALGAFGLIVVSTGLVINRKRKSVQ